MVVDRFYSKVELVPFCDCWLWTSNRNNGGYGLLSFGSPPNRKWRMAHRVSYEIHNGEIPEGMDVLHHCDNPICVNPSHLWLGKDKDNIHDAIRKGRFYENNHKRGLHKLTKEQVKEIISGGSTTRLAKKFGVALSTIKRIKNGRAWKHMR